MVLWFARGLRRGVLTTHYPHADPDPWTADLPTPPVFIPERLTADVVDALVAVCPSAALQPSDHALIYDIGACTACGRCLAAAPQAVRPSGEFELAATTREQLIKHIRFPKLLPLEGPS
jgi:ferredoxin